MQGLSPNRLELMSSSLEQRMGRTSLSELFHHHTRNSGGNPSSKTANSETVGEKRRRCDRWRDLLTGFLGLRLEEEDEHGQWGRVLLESLICSEEDEVRAVGYCVCTYGMMYCIVAGEWLC
ncbi:hypothetical protein KY284_032749 [Solanum tuberosum]|nr:hypothetical protein KY284_032749 [Solanum tuberosum]